MHEWSLVETLLRRAEEKASEHGATAVRRLAISIGELAGVEPDLFDSAWLEFRAGTLCANAALEIRRVAAEWECPSCGEIVAGGGDLRCAACEKPLRLRAGGEILLERMELEVP
jgi:hydrogenase nickel incorporation protein HypA/HybF